MFAYESAYVMWIFHTSCNRMIFWIDKYWESWNKTEKNWMDNSQNRKKVLIIDHTDRNLTHFLLLLLLLLIIWHLAQSCVCFMSPSIHWCQINYPFLCQCFDSNNNNNKNHPDQSRVVTPIDFQLVWRNCHLLFWKFEPLLLLLLLRNSGP